MFNLTVQTRTILIAWELGGGLGHLMRAAALARQLSSAGMRTTVCLADVTDTPWTEWPADTQILPAPRATRLPPHFVAPATFGELLYGCGYHDRGQLSAIITSWLHLLELIEPAVVIADHAPAAQLAARIHGVGTVRVGTGFFAPPVPEARFRTWEAVNPDRIRTTEAIVLGHINAIFDACGTPAAATLVDALRPARDLIAGWPETDCYAALRSPGEVTYLGHERARTSGSAPNPPALWSSADRRVVAYLRGDYQSLEPILESLSERHATLAYLSNIDAALAGRFANERLTLTPAPFDLAAYAATCDALICHAGAGTMPAFIEAGVPVLMLPYQAEQRSNAECIVRLGAGLLLDPKSARATFASTLEQVLGDQRYARAARALAQRWTGHVDGIATAARLICEFIDS